jgi:subtilisin
MAARSDNRRSTSRGDRRKPARDSRPAPDGDRRKAARTTQYMIAPLRPGVSGQVLAERLNRIGNIEILRTHDSRNAVAPPVVVARMSADIAIALLASTAGELIIEPDGRLRAASFAAASPGTSSFFFGPAMMTAPAPDLRVGLRIVGDAGQPVPQAAVRLIGEQTSAQGVTDSGGKVDLTLQASCPKPSPPSSSTRGPASGACGSSGRLSRAMRSTHSRCDRYHYPRDSIGAAMRCGSIGLRASAAELGSRSRWSTAALRPATSN